eukprot:1822893-Pleurochrysis_carterae.AAC.3
MLAVVVALYSVASSLRSVASRGSCTTATAWEAQGGHRDVRYAWAEEKLSQELATHDGMWAFWPQPLQALLARSALS